jgi:hypothetical protein
MMIRQVLFSWSHNQAKNAGIPRKSYISVVEAVGGLQEGGSWA